MFKHWCIYMIFGLLQGKLIGICGSVGCGKSSLLSAILGRVSDLDQV